MADGIAYVRVQADVGNNDIQTLSEPSGGGITYGSYSLIWTFSGGFQFNEGWTIPGANEFLPSITIQPVEGDVEQTNLNISNALNGQNYYYVQWILNNYCGQANM